MKPREGEKGKGMAGKVETEIERHRKKSYSGLGMITTGKIADC